MDVFSAIFSLVIVLLVIYGLSRFAHYIHNTNKKLDEITKKLDEIQAAQNQK
ncbi:hypothetical protein [Halalkalibacter akibai]|uniref:Uncharacterized protein n=1 Tax=Halalkalibacter akibai (strain ATCC 43226 / DSM 21942 / CIP 109018 / JCM 9157 / 1139) TaxID=1236973 RepID=W4QVM7_HALA3|nr:hypothetical protein [Halalkalibacter akibai]GAE36210.1 hypothetical protein JCM9157_3367 [Halalkalibacter akibai JCM 9157]